MRHIYRITFIDIRVGELPIWMNSYCIFATSYGGIATTVLFSQCGRDGSMILMKGNGPYSDWALGRKSQKPASF